MLSDRYLKQDKPIDGGMASVYRCYDQILERSVAYKLVARGSSARRMTDEINALSSVRSKHVVQIYDVVVSPESIGILQEYIDGEDLFSKSVQPENTDDFLRIIWQISSGLADIHAINLIHRDIKPNNMKIDSEGILKIFDFGLSREEGPKAKTIGFVGTPGFAAPELYTGLGQFNKSIDVYALGATALYLLTEEIMTVEQQMSGKDIFANSASKFKFHIPQEILDTLKCCISVMPSDRPSVEAVRDNFAKFILKGKHKALVVLNDKPNYLNSNNPKVSLSYSSIASIEIIYNEFEFVVSSVSGNVYVNNMPVSAGFILPGACVLTFGSPALQHQRKYVTFDISHPEVTV